MQLQGKSWFVLAGGKTRGPFSPDVVRSMKDRGRIHRTSQLSTDRKTWLEATAFEELFVDDAVPIEGALPEAPAEAPEIQYFFNEDGSSSGPVSFEKLREMAAGGILVETDLIWYEGASSWFSASSLTGLMFPTEKNSALAWLNKNRARACFVGASILVLLLLPSWYVMKLNASRTQATKDEQVQAKGALIAAKRIELKEEAKVLDSKMEALTLQETDALMFIQDGPAARDRHADVVRDIATLRNEIIENEDQQRAYEQKLAEEKNLEPEESILGIVAAASTTLLTLAYFLYRSGLTGKVSDETRRELAEAKREIAETRREITDAIRDIKG